MMLGFSVCLVLLLCHSITVSQLRKLDPDCDYNITQLIQSKGYPCEEHKVITNDGYILGVFRIPYGRKSSAKGRPVLLQHGLLDTATTWVINFSDQNLAFILPDTGYDVWLGNVRGNYYSRAHVKYNPDYDEEFWDFSWDEMAKDDLPSMINYILNVTKYTQIGYIGHQKTPLRYLDTDSKELECYWHKLFGRNEFLPTSPVLQWLGKYACGEFFFDRLICENVLFIIGEPDKKNMNSSRIPVYTSHGPSETSVKNMVHFMQCGRSNQFQAYNYGSPEKNELHYNQTSPPLYSIRPMTVPTALF
ncbi:unnamed protein product [Rotaria sp. Silwood1]|nr:unnamed protein product [Rotaria sp. Silwood1]CAF4524930.1 unnamed protein product [Rotaria sp. Silwood1]